MSQKITGNEQSIRYATTKNENGDTIYYAPIEIIDNEDLRNYGITWGDCKTLHFGTSDRVRVYLFPTTNKELADFQWAEINTKHSRGYRSTRCNVPGKRGGLIQCPDTNKCNECPYGRRPEDRKPNTISLDRLSESGYEEAVEDREMTARLAWMEFERLKVWMDAKDLNIAKAIILKEMHGYKVSEIAEELGIDERQVYYCLQQAKDIGKKYGR